MGARLDLFEVGYQYDVGNLLGAVMLAERWAEPVSANVPPRPVLQEVSASDDKSRRGPNLIPQT